MGDYSISNRPVQDWVLYAGLLTNTGIFAAAFGCELHRHEGSQASAIPLVTTAAEADRLTVPDIWKSPTLMRAFELNLTEFLAMVWPDTRYLFMFLPMPLANAQRVLDYFRRQQ